MTDIVVDYAQAQAMVKKAIARRGEGHVYQSDRGTCLYTHATVEGPVCGCIIGDILVNDLNVPIDELFDVEHNRGLGSTGPIAGFRPKIADLWGIAFTDKAMTYLTMVQFHQDRESTWGKAHRVSVRYVAEAADILRWDGSETEPSRHRCDCGDCDD